MCWDTVYAWRWRLEQVLTAYSDRSGDMDSTRRCLALAERHIELCSHDLQNYEVLGMYYESIVIVVRTFCSLAWSYGLFVDLGSRGRVTSHMSRQDLLGHGQPLGGNNSHQQTAPYILLILRTCISMVDLLYISGSAGDVPG